MRLNHPGVVFAARVTWSVIWGVLCLVLIVFWWRSGRYEDKCGWTIGQRHYFSVGSAIERVDFRWQISDRATQLRQGFYVEQTLPEWFPDRVRQERRAGKSAENLLGISLFRRRESSSISVPHSWLVPLSALVAAVPWIRFSLRTVFIAITIAALVLGLTVRSAIDRRSDPPERPADDNPFGSETLFANPLIAQLQINVGLFGD